MLQANNKHQFNKKKKTGKKSYNTLRERSSHHDQSGIEQNDGLCCRTTMFIRGKSIEFIIYHSNGRVYAFSKKKEIMMLQLEN